MNTQRNLVLAAAGVLGFLGVTLGAFGGHALKASLSEVALGWWQTAVEYHLVHAIALLALSFAPGKRALAAWAFGIGIVGFSGSLYLMAVTGWTWLGGATPLGGVSFLVGWSSLIAMGLAKVPSKN